MKCIYFSEGAIEYKKMRTEIITALVIEEEARDAFRQSLNDLFGQCFGPEYKTYPIYWEDIDDENVSAYCHVIRLFNINPNAIIYSCKISDSSNIKKRAAQIKIINEVKTSFNDDVKVFLPANKNGKKIMKSLRNDLLDIDIDCVISQNPLEESRFYQVSYLINNISLYFENDLDYFDNIDKGGKPQLVNFYLDIKKPKDKFIRVTLS